MLLCLPIFPTWDLNQCGECDIQDRIYPNSKQDYIIRILINQCGNI